MLPWKAPLLNLVDAVSTVLFLTLLAVALHLSPVDSQSFLDAFGSIIFFFSLALITSLGCLMMGMLALQRCCRTEGLSHCVTERPKRPQFDVSQRRFSNRPLCEGSDVPNATSSGGGLFSTLPRKRPGSWFRCLSPGSHIRLLNLGTPFRPADLLMLLDSMCANLMRKHEVERQTLLRSGRGPPSPLGGEWTSDL